MEKNKMDSIALRQAATEAYNKQDWKQVIKLCTDIIEQNPKDVHAFNNRVSAYINLKQFDQAIQDFDHAIALNPKVAGAFYNRGVAYRKLKEEETAIADFKKAEKIDPTIISQEQTKKAEESFEKGFKKIQESNKKVRKLQEILEGLEGGHQEEEDNWFKRSKWAVIITLILMLILFVIGLFQSSNTYAVYIFSSIVTFTIIRQYTNAKAMRIEVSNRVAMAEMFERVKNENIDYKKEFLPKLADAIVYSTMKEKNNTDGLLEKIIDILGKFKKT
jgi:tetratricopeptide (TPR) repeat protein